RLDKRDDAQSEPEGDAVAVPEAPGSHGRIRVAEVPNTIAPSVETQGTTILAEPTTAPSTVTDPTDLIAALPQADVATARVLLLTAAELSPLTMPRAKTITRMSQGELYAALGDLVREGSLIPTHTDAGLEWVKS